MNKSPDSEVCVEELLEKISIISMDYDGYRKAADLMSLIDELASYISRAQDALFKGMLFREQLETNTIREDDVVNDNGYLYQVFPNIYGELCYNSRMEYDIDYDNDDNAIDSYTEMSDYVEDGKFSEVFRKIGMCYVPILKR